MNAIDDCRVAIGDCLLHFRGEVEPVAEGDQVAGVGSFERDARADAFEVAELSEQGLDFVERRAGAGELLDRVLSCPDGFHIEQRREHPAAEQPGPGRRTGAVEHREERAFGGWALVF